MASRVTPAEEQFHTSSIYPVPQNWKGETFRIRNNYPSYTAATGIPAVDVYAPWLDIDFWSNPADYAAMVLEYCYEGNVEKDFVVQKNEVRDWYHAPWLHATVNGREPLKGLTFERAIPPNELAAKQTSALQNWAIGFYNSPGALTFGKVWKDPNTPIWNDDLKFHKGTCVFKFLMSTATDEEVETMPGAPTWQAVISPQPDPKVAPQNGAIRNDFASPVRLFSVDFAVADDRSPIGWVFGTFIYDGRSQNLHQTNPWKRLMLIGVQWGNDPTLDQAAVDAGEKPEESWINPDADKLLKEKFKGLRPSWGYNGRLNGPADGFVSSCASCHSTSQSYAAPMVQSGKLVDNKWVPLNERLTMTWFQNVKSGEPFSVRGALSSDYSLQFLMGWNNYQAWAKTQQAQEEETDPRKRVLRVLPGKRVVFVGKKSDLESDKVQKVIDQIVVIDEPMRAGPPLNWVR